MVESSVKLNYKELENLKKAIESVATPDKVDQFMRSCTKELAARLISKTVKRTPVGVYPHRTGGTLRRGWTKANDLVVNKSGSGYTVKIINPVKYASYVEYGHRTANHTGWVEGQFMLSTSENEIRKSALKILKAKLNKYLEGLQKV